MPVKVMKRSSSDNKYLHKDFHISGDMGLKYVGEKYGDNGVKEYLRRFTTSYHSPLIESIKNKGLGTLEKYIKDIYMTEESPEVLKTTLTEKDLLVEIECCPAIAYMKSKGHIPSKWYIEETRTVYETIADNSDLGFELLSYDIDSGKTSYRFFRRCFL